MFTFISSVAAIFCGLFSELLCIIRIINQIHYVNNCTNGLFNEYTPYSKMAANIILLFACLLATFSLKFFCVFYVLTRHQGLINMQTKE